MACRTSYSEAGRSDFRVKTTDFEPVYPMFLAAARMVTGDHVLGVQVLQIAVSCSVASCSRTFTGSGRCGRQRALYAGDLLLIKQSIGQSPFVLVTTLLIAFAYAFVTADTTRRASGPVWFWGCWCWRGR